LDKLIKIPFLCKKIVQQLSRRNLPELNRNCPLIGPDRLVTNDLWY